MRTIKWLIKIKTVFHTSVVLREMHMKTTIEYSFARMAEIAKLVVAGTERDAEQLELLSTVGNSTDFQPMLKSVAKSSS